MAAAAMQYETHGPERRPASLVTLGTKGLGQDMSSHLNGVKAGFRAETRPSRARAGPVVP
jgi:hypothetical protein